MNSGAGGIGAIYVNERFLKSGSTDFIPMYKGWWGNNLKTKFLMSDEFDPAHGADAFKLSNPSPVLNAMLMTSLEIFDQTSMEELRQKEYLLTGYLEYFIKLFFPQNSTKNQKSTMPSVNIITPSDPEQRGAQLSLMFSVPLAIVQEQFQKRGIVVSVLQQHCLDLQSNLFQCDIRMPSVMRVAPTPLYNSFTDVYKLITTMRDIFQDVKKQDTTDTRNPKLETSIKD